jgi:uncharacterized DUF497 family protein
MKFEWDENKSLDCFRIRGFHFHLAAQVFGDPQRKVQLDSRFIYGEDRYLALGRVDDRVLTVVYTTRNDAIRIISARKANAREVKKYENNTSLN